MVAPDLIVDSRVSLIGVGLLWFFTVWQSYVIEATRARLAGLREVWRETLSLDPAWRYCAAVRAVEKLLDASNEALPRLSLAFLLAGTLVPTRGQREARLRIYECLSQLPSTRLQQEALSIVETATRYVGLAALKRSLLVWTLAPLWVAAFVVWSVHWQLRVLLEGAPPSSLHDSRVRLRRKLIRPLVGIVSKT